MEPRQTYLHLPTITYKSDRDGYKMYGLFRAEAMIILFFLELRRIIHIPTY